MRLNSVILGKGLKPAFERFHGDSRCIKAFVESYAVKQLEFACEVMHLCAEGMGDFKQRIYGRRLLAPLNAADENGRETRFFRQRFLAETGFLSFGPNGLAQKATVFGDRHGPFRRQETKRPSHVVNDQFSLPEFRSDDKKRGGFTKLTFQRVIYENILTRRPMAHREDHGLTPFFEAAQK